MKHRLGLHSTLFFQNSKQLDIDGVVPMCPVIPLGMGVGWGAGRAKAL